MSAQLKSCTLLNQSIGIRINKSNENLMYAETHFGGVLFNRKNATTALGANAHKTLKLLGALE